MVDASPPRPEPGQFVGRVLRVTGGSIFLERDPHVEMTPGDRVAFYDDLGDERVVGRVRRVNRRTYEIRVHVNDTVAVGERGYHTLATPTSTLVAPALSDARGEVALDIKPWLGLDGDESGALIEGYLSYTIGPRFRLTAAAEPVSPGLGDAPDAFEAFIAPSVVFPIAEMGFGVGAGTANYAPEPGVGILFSPILRVGAKDGLYFRARSSAVLKDERAHFGTFRVDGAIPIAYGTRLLVGGGGGDSGYTYGQVGLELLLVGNGRRGSWFGRGLFGYGGNHGQVRETPPLGYPPDEEYWVGVQADGPFLGLGVTHRF